VFNFLLEKSDSVLAFLVAILQGAIRNNGLSTRVNNKRTVANPLISSGIAMTAASAQAGEATRADSISAVPSLCPAFLITSSVLPVIQINPSYATKLPFSSFDTASFWQPSPVR
jgi:hypothetical protein